jgi:hypothetical protein
MIKREQIANILAACGMDRADSIMSLITDEQDKYTRLVDAAIILRKRYSDNDMIRLEYEPVKALLQAAEEFLPLSLADRLEEFTNFVPRYDEFKQLIEEIRELEDDNIT